MMINVKKKVLLCIIYLTNSSTVTHIQEEDVDIIVHHIVGVIDSFSRKYVLHFCYLSVVFVRAVNGN